MTQAEYLKQASTLTKKYPDAEIHICVHADERLLQSTWTDGKISKVKLGWWFCDGNGSAYTEVNEVIKYLSERDDLEVTADEAHAHMDRAILIYTHAG